MSLRSALENAVLTQDGSMGMRLEALLPQDHPLSVKGLPLWSTKVLLADPAWITKVHQSYVDAGCDMLITSAYQASQQTLQKHAGLSGREIRDVWQRLIDCATTAAALATKKVWIAASVGPYGAYLANGAEYSGDYGHKPVAELAAYHRDMVSFYVENAGVDVIAFETIPNFDEIKAILALLRDIYTPDFHKPFYLNFSCKDERTLVDGTPLAAVVEYLISQRVGVVGNDFVGTGCNCVAYELVDGIVATINDACTRNNAELFNLVVYPNLGFSNDMSDPSKYEFKSNTEGWRNAVQRWLSVPNVRVIGGCCSTGPEEVQIIHDAVEASTK